MMIRSRLFSHSASSAIIVTLIFFHTLDYIENQSLTNNNVNGVVNQDILIKSHSDWGILYIHLDFQRNIFYNNKPALVRINSNIAQ